MVNYDLHPRNSTLAGPAGSRQVPPHLPDAGDSTHLGAFTAKPRQAVIRNGHCGVVFLTYRHTGWPPIKAHTPARINIQELLRK